MFALAPGLSIAFWYGAAVLYGYGRFGSGVPAGTPEYFCAVCPMASSWPCVGVPKQLPPYVPPAASTAASTRFCRLRLKSQKCAASRANEPKIAINGNRTATMTITDPVSRLRRLSLITDMSPLPSQ